MDYTGRIITKNQVVPTASSAPGIWTLDEAMQYTKQGKWPPGYQISRSVRLRSSASAYFNRTLSTPTNNKIWTWSAWLKRGTIGDGGTTYISKTSLFEAPSSGSTFDSIYIKNADAIVWYFATGGATTGYLESTALFRDPSAWYHLVFVYDSTQATDSNRMKVYVNGSQIAVTSAQYVAQNTNSRINSAVVHKIGAFDADSRYADCYLTEINFVDGQALTPASFGYADTVTGVWQPAPYNGTYGANGFYLNFKDPTSTTTIGYDYSGNSNNWTANNISVTAGTTYDSMVDVPINWGTDTGVGGEVRGNYPTFSPIDVSPSSTAQTITQGNLSLFSSSATRIDGAYSTMAVTSGKWYVELTCTTRTGDYPTAGWCATSFNTNGSGWQWQAGGPNNTKGAALDPGGSININGATTAQNYYGTTWSTGNVIQVAVDIDNKLIWFGKAGSWTGTAGNMNGNPATGTNGASFSAQGGTEWKFQSCIGDNARGDVNFGQRPFSYTAPSGFKALCSQNMSVPTILNGANYMAATIWTGNGASSVTVNNSVNSISFQPDFVWAKNRTTAVGHSLYDSIRGAGANTELASNSTNAEGAGNQDQYGYLSAFNSNGFTGVNGSSSPNYYFNESGSGFVGWQWKGGGTAVTNTNGTITSSVSANTTAGFSVVTYTSTTGTVGHGLGVAPSMIIMKGRNVTDQWTVGHAFLNGGSSPWNYGLPLQDTAAIQTSSGFWNNTAPTSTVFSQGSWDSGYTKVAYCFAAISGYSAFGSYTGNGSTDGPFIYLGFRPRFVLVRDTVNVTYWEIGDSSRNTYNAVDANLYPNSAFAEAADPMFDFLANGFKVRKAGGNFNNSGAATIYAAFAENPFTISRAR